MSERTLYQFTISHYCLKTRWNLEAKGLDYRIANLAPGLHRLTARRLGAGTSVPILVDRGRAIGDSTEIALHLEQAYPARPLLPKGEAARRRALELEGFFDEEFGMHARRWAYFQILATPELPKLVFAELSWPVRVLGRIGAPVFRLGLRRMYDINAATAAASHARVLGALDRLERELGGDPARYLVDDRFGLADLTAAALLAPLLAPPGSPWVTRPGMVVPDKLLAMRSELAARPAGRWLSRVWAADRGPAAP